MVTMLENLIKAKNKNKITEIFRVYSHINIDFLKKSSIIFRQKSFASSQIATTLVAFDRLVGEGNHKNGTHLKCGDFLILYSPFIFWDRGSILKCISDNVRGKVYVPEETSSSSIFKSFNHSLSTLPQVF